MRYLSAVIVASGLLVLTFGEAPVSAQSIKACYNNTNGNLRFVSGPGDCRTQETFITWGATGTTGAVGPTGPAGAAGANGAVGPTGPAGANGAVGPTGPAGVAGANGAVGPTGPAGVAGANGAVGPTGPAGVAGANGAVGPTGPAGADGADGAPGAIGPTGPAGADGTNGINGAIGPTGPQGPTGPAGSGAAFTPTLAIFGVGPITHSTGAHYILETTQADTLQLRTTVGGAFVKYGFVHPTSCAGTGSNGSSTAAETHRFSFTVGDTLTATFCAEGSTILVTVTDVQDVALYRCQRYAGNANNCLRLQ